MFSGSPDCSRGWVLCSSSEELLSYPSKSVLHQRRGVSPLGWETCRPSASSSNGWHPELRKGLAWGHRGTFGLQLSPDPDTKYMWVGRYGALGTPTCWFVSGERRLVSAGPWGWGREGIVWKPRAKGLSGLRVQ